MSKWKEKFEKIWTLFKDGGENRKMALSLLDALLEPAKMMGEMTAFDTLFAGIEIGRDGLSIPNIIREELEAVVVSRWNKDPLKKPIQDSQVIEIFELYFRMYPEKIQELPSFLCLEGCDHVPSFCGPESPVRALGFFPPFEAIANIAEFPNIERLHFYATSPTFATFKGLGDYCRICHLDIGQEKLQSAVNAAYHLPHVNHVFTFGKKASVKSIDMLLSTNLQSKAHSNKVKYVTNCRTQPQQMRLETVATDIDGETFFIIDTVGALSGDIQEHPKLQSAVGLFNNLKSLLAHQTPYNVLERLYQDQYMTRYSTKLFLDDDTHKPIGERVVAIHAENDAESINKLLSEGKFPNCRQVIYEGVTSSWRARSNIVLSLSADFLKRYPKLEVLKCSHVGWRSKTEFSIDPNFWTCQYPLSLVWNQSSRDSTMIGFSSDEGTFQDRLLSWQDNIAEVTKHQDFIAKIQYLRLHKGDTLGPLLPFIPDVKTLETYPQGLTLEDEIDGSVESFEDQMVAFNLESAEVYRTAIMTSVRSIQDAWVLVQRKEAAQRDALNTKIPFSPRFHEEMATALQQQSDTAVKLLEVLSEQQSRIKIGHFYYIKDDGQWVQTRRRRIDEEYVQRFLDPESYSVQFNLNLAFNIRPFRVEDMPEVTKVLLNTDAVTLMDIKDLKTITHLRVERPLSEEELVCLSEMDHLRILYLRNEWPTGAYESFPKALCRLENLEELYIPNHQITALPQDVVAMKSLKSISLRGNPMTRVDDVLKTLNKLPSLKSLYAPDLSGLQRTEPLSYTIL